MQMNLAPSVLSAVCVLVLGSGSFVHATSSELSATTISTSLTHPHVTTTTYTVSSPDAISGSTVTRVITNSPSAATSTSSRITSSTFTSVASSRTNETLVSTSSGAPTSVPVSESGTKPTSAAPSSSTSANGAAPGAFRIDGTVLVGAGIMAAVAVL